VLGEGRAPRPAGGAPPAPGYFPGSFTSAMRSNSTL
jgi:hypothetical protein